MSAMQVLTTNQKQSIKSKPRSVLTESLPLQNVDSELAAASSTAVIVSSFIPKPRKIIDATTKRAIAAMNKLRTQQ